LLIAAIMTCAAPPPARPGPRSHAPLRPRDRALQQKGSLLASPGGLDPSSARARGAPVPEKAWAARNVARSLIGGGGAAGAEEGVRMLREAAAECRDYYGPTHPGQLSTLLDLIGGLLALVAEGGHPEAKAEAAAAIERVLGIVQVGDRGGGWGGGGGAKDRAGGLGSQLHTARRARAFGLTANPAAAAASRAPHLPARPPPVPSCPQAVGERYRAQGDLLSLVLLYESAQAELDYPQVLAPPPSQPLRAAR
jgi:hypothetical protein